MVDRPPPGPKYTIHQTENSGEVRELVRDLQNDLLQINFNGIIIRDPSTQLDYTGTQEFVEDLVNLMVHPTINRELDSIS